MKNFNLDSRQLHILENEFPQLLDHIDKLKPDLFKDGNRYCCISGPSPSEGFLGWGSTVEAAISDWVRKSQKAGSKNMTPPR